MAKCCGVHTIRQEDVDEAMKDVELDFSEAVVTSEPENKIDLVDLAARDIFRNDTDKVNTEQYTIGAKWINSKELWKLKTSGWSMSGRLGVAHQGAEGSATATYQRGKLEAEINKNTIEVEKQYSKNIEMKPHSRYEVTVVKQETTYAANIEGLLLTFPSNASIKTSRVGRKKKLSKILSRTGNIVSKNGDKITARIAGKFEAKNVTAEVKAFQIP